MIAEELARLLDRERRGRLVQDQNPGGGGDPLDDLHELAIGEAERSDLEVRLEPDAASGEMARGSVLDPAPADEAGQARRRLPAEQDVLGDGELRQQAELLMDERDAVRARLRRGRDLNRLTVDLDRAAVVREQAGEDAHDRRLAGAVLADQAVHLRGRELEIDPGDRGGGAKHLADAGHADDRQKRPGQRPVARARPRRRSAHRPIIDGGRPRPPGHAAAVRSRLDGSASRARRDRRP